MDEFESTKERVRELRRDVPSRGGCLARLKLEGIAAPIALASVEAVFEEARQAVGARGSVSPLLARTPLLARVKSVGVSLVLFGVAASVASFVLLRIDTTSFLSLLHLGSIGLTYWILDSARRLLGGQTVALA